MECKSCGSKNIEKQGYAVVGQDRKEEWASEFLNDKMYTCQDCRGTFCYKDVYLPDGKWKLVGGAYEKPHTKNGSNPSQC